MNKPNTPFAEEKMTIFDLAEIQGYLKGISSWQENKLVKESLEKYSEKLGIYIDHELAQLKKSDDTNK